MRPLLLPLLCLLVLPWHARAEATPADHASDRPNIITVFIDDMGWSDLSCFGGTRAETEHIDRLAREGIRFTNFYVNSPICSPSRVALTTGQYPHRWRITSYLNNRKSNLSRGMAQWLDPKAPVLARELRKNGYATGHFGKWHMGGQRDVDDAPPITAYGFDRSLTNFEGMGAKLLPLTLKPGQDPARPGRIWDKAERLGEPVTWMQRSEITGGFVQAALEFIDEAQENRKPFFVNVWPDDVHSPFWPPVDRWGDGDKRTLYYAVLDAMDEQLGLLFDRIRNDEALRDNTLILVCSDNGHEQGAGSSDPLRGAKTWLYEGGVRSPLIAWGPGLVAKEATGTTNSQSIFSAIDLNRSLYALTGTPVPEGSDLDGEELAATLVGRAKDSRIAPIFFRRPPDRPGFGHGFQEDNPDLAMRDGKWKFYINYDGSDPQLYHLGKDEAEQHNVAENFPRIVEELQAKLKAWNDQMPVDAGDPSFGKPAPQGAVPEGRFVNPIGEGADPWVVRDEPNNRYLWCFSEGNRGIAIHPSANLTSLGPKHVVWTAPEEGPFSREVWAPELHFLESRWHIYFAASDGRNENHLAYVLRSKTEDALGEYELHGPLATGEGGDGRSPNIWAIDMTPLVHDGKLHALWSGWDAPGTDRQFLYIAPMKSPVELGGPRVKICSNDDHPWEFTEEDGKGRGLNEAPQVLETDGHCSVIYSCGASWLPTYKLGALTLVGDDPLKPASWLKSRQPVFASTGETYGVGHSCFVRSPDQSEWWHVFHAKRDRNPGWRRAIFVQKLREKGAGPLQFLAPVQAGAVLNRPSGEGSLLPILPYQHSLRRGDDFTSWNYLGHHQYYQHSDRGVHLGSVPAHPINQFRCGEKMVLDSRLPHDLTLEVTVDLNGDSKVRGAGVLVRTSGAAVGWDAHRGYYAGLKPDSGHVIFGRMNGERWEELKRVEATFPVDGARLRVDCRGSLITVSVDGTRVLEQRDSTYASGTVGLRVVDTHAVFSDLVITAPNP